ncbi:MAG: hypothetical protein PQJ59_12430 [Spirochaetales bacterium]|nr:hypothetical protein [Spirochaetales bacterium]
MFSLIKSLLLIFSGLTLGYLVQYFRPADYRKVRRRIQFVCLIFLSPLAVIGSVWVAPWRHWEIMSLPFIGLSCLVLGAFCALFLARFMGFDREQRTVYFICGGFSNLGSLGGLTCFMILGEAGYALGPFYSLFERIWYYMVGFPMARRVSPRWQEEAEDDSRWQRLKTIFWDPFILVTLGSTFLGIILNLTVERPVFWADINRFIIPVNSFFLMISIGLAMKFGPMRNYLKPALAIWGIKSLVMPTFNFAAGTLLGLGHVAGGLPLKVVVLLGAMPVAFNALVPPTQYDLDLDLANTCWFLTTMGLAVVIPVLTLLF